MEAQHVLRMMHEAIDRDIKSWLHKWLELLHLVCLNSPFVLSFSILCDTSKSVPSPNLEPQRVRLLTPGGAKGLKKNVLRTRRGRCNRKASQITMFQDHECMETQETWDWKSLKGTLDWTWTQPKSNPVERVHTERNSGKSLWMTDRLDRNQLTDKLTFIQKQFSPTSWPWWIRSEGVGGWRELGGVQIRCMHVDLHKRSVDRRTNAQQGKGRVPEETLNVHGALHKLGLCRCFRRSRMGVVKDNYPIRGKIWAWYWISKSLSRAWYNGASCGFQHLRIRIRSWEMNWKSKSTTKLSIMLS